MSTEEIRAQTYVGFDSITQQIEHKLLKRGFQFNVIVVGKLFVLLAMLSVCADILGLRGFLVKESRENTLKYLQVGSLWSWLTWLVLVAPPICLPRI